MILYEIQFKEKVRRYKYVWESVYFSNLIKAKSFLTQNKGHLEDSNITRHVILNNKIEMTKFLNRSNQIG